MSRFEAKKLGYLAAVAGVLTLIAVQGCSSDDTQASPTAGAGGKLDGGAGGKANGGASGKDSGGGAGNVGGDAGTGAVEETGGTPGEAGAGGEGGAVNCDGEDGCYSCTPTTNAQLLNHCVPGGCPATFDNSTLTKFNLVGTL